jgi:UDP-N-acetylmuramoylalanine--D-glutamate ligase
MSAPADLRRGAGRPAIVAGYARTGQVAARWLAEHGWKVSVVEDDAERGSRLACSEAFPVEMAPAPSRAAQLGAGAALVMPSPGVPFGHPLVAAALGAGVPVVAEVELAWAELEARRRNGAATTLVGVTGTNGKTTVAELVGEMLRRSGRQVVVAGNVGYPLLAAVSAPVGQAEAVIVAELSSFQLCFVHELRPDVACWLNFAPDHLDWHPDLGHYAAAKARIWAKQVRGSTAVVNVADPVVAEAASTIPAGVEIVTFGPKREADAPSWAFGSEGVEGPGGFRLAAQELARSFPHDLANVAAAAAVAVAAGASLPGCAAAAREHVPPPHRVELVGEAGGVSWYDDSKATTPASVLAAVRAFGSVVLIAGGRNKGLDLSVLADAVPPVRAVVAIGEAAGEVAEAFAGRVPVRPASSMEEAVESARQLARPGDAVVLSPGCASFDWYGSYAQRGEHFSSLVRARVAGPEALEARL